MMDPWFDAKEQSQFPIIGFVDEADKLLAFGTYGTFRAWPAYKYTVEHSLYVERSVRGHGLGSKLLQLIVRFAQEQGYHNLIGGIAADNEASIRTHLKAGFVHCGTIQQCGFKFGKWIDLSFYQKLLSTPKEPFDG